MKLVTNVINKIRGGHHSLMHRQFKTFLKDVESEYSDLLMYTEVRWLSRGNCLRRFFDLRSQVMSFIENIKSFEDLLKQMREEHFFLELAFLADICHMLNVLNVKLQRSNQIIFDLISCIDEFIDKLNILISDLSSNSLVNLECCQLIAAEKPQSNFKVFVVDIERLKQSLEDRFKDFQLIRRFSHVFSQRNHNTTRRISNRIESFTIRQINA